MTDRYGAAMKGAVRRALESFARQDGEFAQAIAQGGSFTDCMKRVAGGVKTGPFPTWTPIAGRWNSISLGRSSGPPWKLTCVPTGCRSGLPGRTSSRPSCWT